MTDIKFAPKPRKVSGKNGVPPGLLVYNYLQRRGQVGATQQAIHNGVNRVTGPKRLEWRQVEGALQTMKQNGVVVSYQKKLNHDAGFKTFYRLATWDEWANKKRRRSAFQEANSRAAKELNTLEKVVEKKAVAPFPKKKGSYFYAIYETVRAYDRPVTATEVVKLFPAALPRNKKPVNRKRIQKLMAQAKWAGYLEQVEGKWVIASRAYFDERQANVQAINSKSLAKRQTPGQLACLPITDNEMSVANGASNGDNGGRAIIDREDIVPEQQGKDYLLPAIVGIQAAIIAVLAGVIIAGL